MGFFAKVQRKKIKKGTGLERVFIYTCILMISLESVLVSAQVKNLNEIQIYHRCYQLLTKDVVPVRDARAQRVQNGDLSGAQACDELLNLVQLGADGLVGNDRIGLKIFKNFHEFHSSWFDSHFFDARVPTGELLGSTSHALFDEAEPAVFITRSLFTPNASYASTLQGTESYEMIRPAGETYWDYRGNKRADFVSGPRPANNQGLSPIWNPQPRELNIGDPLGVQPIPATNLPRPYLITIPRRPTGRANVNENPIALNNPIEVFRSFGGGILGSRSFLLMNLNKNYNYRSDGAVATNRHWAVSIYEGLLCKHLPMAPLNAIPDAMVVANSEISYRKARACVQCHASVDRLANVSRNIRYALSTTHMQNRFGMVSIHTYNIPVDQPSLGAQDAWTTATVDNNFSRRPPRGVLFFQSYDGTLIDQPATGFEEMGAAIAQTNDFNVCAAKRYYKYLTGIDVDLDPKFLEGNPSASESYHRNLVVQLGLALKGHGDLRKLASDIIHSETFKSVNFLAEDQ